ncbi:MgtC/SapB family protein [Fundicoccus culcitae]|uniref:MgtC/SapB family protein n=1 Tax=Fundicoccus culcitae TaxID=2969821 RepID=A0ABY5P5S2_9LACT|nr:MgtC/SapB family protein [Fundicoccus culcitae]UUX33830.1 MgtC/SapB family protein [Fundicoccus culcitae]
MALNLYELNTVTILVRMLLAILIGGLLGVERGYQHRTAGLRTYILVCLGSAIIMMTNQYVFVSMGVSDPTRMGAQVVSGIGFLGAGTILVTDRNRVKGLTTAAGLWAAASIGLAVGIGFYEGAIIGGVAILLTMTALRPLKRYIQGHSSKLDCFIIADSLTSFNGFLKYCSDTRVKIIDLNLESNHGIELDKAHGVVYYVSVDLNNFIKQAEFIDAVKHLKGINYFEEITDE